MKKPKLSPEELRKLKKELRKEAEEKVLSRALALKEEYKKQVSTAIITAFGLVIALVWKDVVTALLPSITTPMFLARFPFLASVYVAVIITVLAVTGILIIAKWAKGKEEGK